MTTYAFSCPECYTKEERIRLMKDADKPAHCSKCGEEMKMDLYAPNFAFIGQGFPSNDFRKKGRK